MGGPHVGPPTWAQAPAPPAPAPDEFSDPNLTPLPTHPGMKYVARTLAAMMTAPWLGRGSESRHFSEVPQKISTAGYFIIGRFAC